VVGRSSVEAPSDADGHLDNHELSINDLFIKDAFLVFRALCKLTMKPLNTERYSPRIIPRHDD
jgi:brefeldin A-inhibited guanine nucleotide-exchange protein